MKLEKQFRDFDTHIKLTTETGQLKEKRETLQKDFESKFPPICTDKGIALNKSDMRFIDQGSYKINTAIKNPDGDVDRDVAAIFPLDIITHNDPRKLKKYAKQALLIENKRIPIIKEPCITVDYKSNIHIDFPMYAQCNGLVYLARGKENSDTFEWQPADPDGLNSYFLDNFKDNEQKRRLVRYIKQWKYIKYNNSTTDNEVPPSIALTILVCQYFFASTEDGKDYDLYSFYKTLNNICASFLLTKNIDNEIIKAEITCDLPVKPWSDVMYKMKKSDSHGVKFFNRLCKARDNLKEAFDLESEHDAAKCVQKVLGIDFQVPVKDAKIAKTTNKKEHSFG